MSSPPPVFRLREVVRGLLPICFWPRKLQGPMPRWSSHMVYAPSSNFLILRSISFFERPAFFMLFRIWKMARAIWMSFSSSSSRSSSSDVGLAAGVGLCGLACVGLVARVVVQCPKGLERLA